ncbi:MAG: hypothetical protein QXX95_07585 [Nitrososphaerales archaeon]
MKFTLAQKDMIFFCNHIVTKEVNRIFQLKEEKERVKRLKELKKAYMVRRDRGKLKGLDYGKEFLKFFLRSIGIIAFI